jgi:hypothetical protein
MSQIHDPYLQWLGIPREEQPPHLYRLLGLPLYESDMEAIAQAADRRIAFVKAFQTGPDAEIAYRIMNELTQARTCLLSMVSKWEYDRRLQEHFAALAAAAETAAAAAGVQTPTRDASVAAEEPLHAIPGLSLQRPPLRRRRKVAMVPLLVSAAIFGLICVVSIAAWQVLANRDDGSGQRSLLIGRLTRDAREQELTLQARGQANGVEADLTATEKLNLKELLNQGRAAMTARDMEKADRCTLAAVNMARGDDRALANRVRTLFKWADLFWQLVGDEIRHFEPGRELHLGGTIVAVVETQGEEFTIRAEGRNHRVAFRQLSPKIAEAIALSRLSESGDDRELCLGAFWAMDRWGDRELARRHWEQAGDSGRALMPELQLAPPVELPRPDDWGAVANGWPPEKQKPEPAPLATPAAVAPTVPEGRQPAPDAATVAKAEKIVEQTFALVGALSAKERAELVVKLCQTGKSESDPAARFALYHAAVEQAVKVGDPEQICKCIDALDEHFAIDALLMKTKMLWAAYRSDRTVAYREATVKQCSALLTVAMNCQNYAAADYAVRVAMLGAQTSKDLSEAGRLEKLAKKIRAEKGP